MPLRESAHDETLSADMHAFVVLKPLSHPELSEIRIGKLFTIGRTEQPFATYARDVIIDLSRQHARIFSQSTRLPSGSPPVRPDRHQARSVAIG